jgi:hypothetical protein
LINQIIMQRFQMRLKVFSRFTDGFVYKDFVRQGLIVTAFSSSRSTLRTRTVISLPSTISLPVSSNSNDNNINSNGQRIQIIVE